MRLRWCLALIAVLAAGGVRAQMPDDALEAALAHWRAASWYARIGNVDVAAIEVEGFRDKWRAVGSGAPSAVAGLAEAASAALETNDAATAGRSLGAIGDALSGARRAAGQSGFPEAMRDYRDTVERLSVLLRLSEQRGGAPFDDARRAEVRSAAAAAAAAAAKLPPLTPARWADDAKLRTLQQQNAESLREMLTALDRPSPRATGLEIAGLINVVRSNYYLMFLDYGY